MSKTYAFARRADPTNPTVWAEQEDDAEEGVFWVINGHYNERPYENGSMVLVWEGQVPSPQNQDYNEALNWIRNQIND
jgi:hypothetical protein